MPADLTVTYQVSLTLPADKMTSDHDLADEAGAFIKDAIEAYERRTARDNGGDQFFGINDVLVVVRGVTRNG